MTKQRNPTSVPGSPKSPNHEVATTFPTIIDAFSENLESLRDLVTVTLPHFNEQTKKLISDKAIDLLPLIAAAEQLKGDTSEMSKVVTLFNEKTGSDLKITVSEVEGQRSATVKMKHVDPERLQTTFENYARALDRRSLLLKSMLLTLTSQTEWFFSQLLHIHFASGDSPFGAKDNVFSYEDLKRIGSIEDARQMLLEMKVEKILRTSVKDWIVTLKDTMRLSMGYLIPHTDAIVEIYQRRNLLVHNGGVVNNIYLANVPAARDLGIKVRDMLDVSDDYLDNAINTIELCFLLIAAELWKSLKPKDATRATSLMLIGFKHLQAERWPIAEGLYLFVSLDKQQSELDRLLSQLNYWQCKKWRGEFETVRKDVESADFTGSDDLLKLGLVVLQGKPDEVKPLLRSLIRQKRFTKENFATWPIFRELRKDPGFAAFMPKQSTKSASPKPTETVVKQAVYKV